MPLGFAYRILSFAYGNVENLLGKLDGIARTFGHEPSMPQAAVSFHATEFQTEALPVLGFTRLNYRTGTTLVTSTELYDPVTGKWTVNGNTGATAQFGFSVTLLNTGKVLIAGGVNCVYPRPCRNVNFAEVYDPSVGASTITGSMNVARSGHSATLLSNGQVLAAGGETQNNVGKFSITNTAELYTP